MRTTVDNEPFTFVITSKYCTWFPLGFIHNLSVWPLVILALSDIFVMNSAFPEISAINLQYVHNYTITVRRQGIIL